MSRSFQVIDDTPVCIPLKARIACCDCGLTHDTEFEPIYVMDGGKHFDVDGNEREGSILLLMTTRRNERSTAQMRRYHHRIGSEK